MKKWLNLLFPIRLIVLAVMLFVAWQAWVFWRPRPRQFIFSEVRALRAACLKTADLLADKTKQPTRFGLAHLANDPTDVATCLLRDALSSKPGWKVEQTSPVRKFVADVAIAVSRATSLDEVMNAGRRVELDVIVAGRVLAVELTNDIAQAALQIYAYDVRPGQWILKDTVTGEWRPGLIDKTAEQIRRTSPWIRIVVWLVFVLALPWVTAFATHWTLEKKSNLAGFALLGAYTALDMAVAVILVDFTVSGGRQWFRFLLAFILSSAYNYWACERIAKQK